MAFYRGPSTARGLRMLLVAAFAAVAVPGSARAAEYSATPSTFPTVFANAQAGDIILLASGDYGRFNGAMKSGEVVLRPQPGATPTMELYFSPARNITIDGLKLTDIIIGDSRTKNITVRNSDIPGQTVIRTSEIDNANILFDRNVHRDYSPCSDGCYDGRVTLPGSDNQAFSGVTIQNSEFTGGMADGIQNGARGTRILNNTFHDLVPGPADGSGQHTDAIQLYGSRETLIKGNYFYDTGSRIMAPDGAVREIIEDNVFGPGRYPYSIMLWSDDHSIIRHNTLAPGDCWFNLRCGIVSLGSKVSGCRFPDSCDPGVGTIVQDNILATVSVSDGHASFTSSHNLFNVSTGRGERDAEGQPRFAGGPEPASYAGFALAAGSLGKGTASDGLDRGIRVTAVPVARRKGRAIAVFSSLRSISKSGRLRLRVRTAVRGTIRISASLRLGRRLRSGRSAHARKLVRLARRTLKRRESGTLRVTMRINSRAARKSLARHRDARLSIRVSVGDTVERRTLTLRR